MILHTRLPRLVGAAAMALYLVVLVVPERRGDVALLAHERVHQREQLLMQAAWVWLMLVLQQLVPAVPLWLALVPVWGVLYAVPLFRLRAEVRAYRVQVRQGASLEGCARALATLYRLRIDVDTARKLLSSTA